MTETDGARSDGGRPPPRDAAASSAAKRQKVNADHDGQKTEFDVVVENWANVHSYLAMHEVVFSLRTCRRLHDLCVDSKGKLRVNEIEWGVSSSNFEHYYRMLQQVRLDEIKILCIELEGATLTTQQITMVFAKLASEHIPFTCLQKFEIASYCSFPDGLELVFADIGAKLARQSPALRTLKICAKAFSRTAFQLVKPVLEENSLKTLTLEDVDTVAENKQDLVDNEEAKELAELILASSNLEHLRIALEDSEEARITSWFRSKLYTAIRTRDRTAGTTLASPGQLRTLSFKADFPDDGCCLHPEQLGTVLNYFGRGGQLAALELIGSWAGIRSIPELQPDYADTISKVLHRWNSSIRTVSLRDMYDHDGLLWTALAHFAFIKRASCQVTYQPCNSSTGNETPQEWRAFLRGLKRGALSLVPLIDGRGGSSKLSTSVKDVSGGGWDLVIDEVTNEGCNVPPE